MTNACSADWSPRRILDGLLVGDDAAYRELLKCVASVPHPRVRSAQRLPNHAREDVFRDVAHEFLATLDWKDIARFPIETRYVFIRAIAKCLDRGAGSGPGDVRERHRKRLREKVRKVLGALPFESVLGPRHVSRYRLRGRSESRPLVERSEVAARLAPIAPEWRAQNERQGPILIEKDLLRRRLEQSLEFLGNHAQLLDVLNDIIYASFSPPIEEPHLGDEADSLDTISTSGESEIPFAARLPLVAQRVAEALTARQRLVLVATADEERSGAEVALELGVSPQTISNDKTLALSRLRAVLDDEALNDHERELVVGYLLETLRVGWHERGATHDP